MKLEKLLKRKALKTKKNLTEKQNLGPDLMIDFGSCSNDWVRELIRRTLRGRLRFRWLRYAYALTMRTYRLDLVLNCKENHLFIVAKAIKTDHKKKCKS